MVNYKSYIMISSRIDIEEVKKLTDKEFSKIEDKVDEIDASIENKNKITDTQLFVRKSLYPLPPYNFTYEMIERIEKVSREKLTQENIVAQSFNRLLKDVINKDINKYFRLVKIDNLLMNLVERTDNEIFYRPLITPTMFIDNEIWFENKIIKGITVVDLDFYEDFTVNLELSTKITFKSENKNYLIFFFMVDKVTYDISVDFCTLEYDMASTNKELKQYLRNIICNILDMIYAMDDKLHITTIETTKEQNEKRIKREQIPLPTKIFIKPKDDFKQYVYKFIKDMDEGIRKIGHKFLVRGHWRHFRAERYKKETKAKSIWIKPFWKGEGIPVAKEYVLTK